MPGSLHVLGHLFAPTELVDKRLIEPRLVDPQIRVREQAVAIEPLDVVPLERAAISPDMHLVFLHRHDEHGAGHGTADRRGVEVRNAGGRNVERAALQHGQPFGYELAAAIDQPRVLRAVMQCAPRDVVVIGFVGLAEVGRVRVRDRALPSHPMKRRAGIETA